MPPLPTFSCRAPIELQPLIRDVARALRERPELAEAVRALIAGDASADAVPPAVPPLVARVEAIEAELGELKRRLLPVAPQAEPLVARSIAPDGSAWTTTNPNGKVRVTEEGKAEVLRRLKAGEQHATIARAMGITATTIQRHAAAFVAAGALAADAEKPVDQGDAEAARSDYFSTTPGGQVRMTDAGRAEVERRLLAGESNTTITAAVGCSGITVNKARTQMRANELLLMADAAA